MTDPLDHLIARGLSTYSNASPRWGLEKRVLRNVLGRSTDALRFPRWVWAIPALIVGIILGIVVAPPLRSMLSAVVQPSVLAEWCARLQGTSLSVSIRESELFWWYIEGAHLLGLAVMLGPAMMLDLRLIGVLWTNDPVSKVEARFLPITVAGFLAVVTTGVLLFISEPVKCYESTYFRVKMGLILVAGLNALVFHTTIDRRHDDWDTALPTPTAARVAGVLGLLVWTAVIFAGRYMAYTFS